ncbi:MAG: amidophosphoribosyltransferase [Pseudomonadota bacterium]
MCGVIGIVGSQNQISGDFSASWAAYQCYQGLLTLQHRGQDAAGIVSYHPESPDLIEKRDIGLVARVFLPEHLHNLQGHLAIGHTRYVTVGGNNPRDIQPLCVSLPYKMALAHNGNLVNYYNLRTHLTENLGIELATGNDAEVLIKLFAYELRLQKGPFTFDKAVKAAAYIFEQAIGSYAVVGLVEGHGLFAIRDPHGIRPISLGRKKSEGRWAYIATSETAAMNFLGYEYMREVLPGEIVFVDLQGQFHSQVIQKDKARHACMFEWVYFASAESNIEGRTVYTARLRLGKALAAMAREKIQKGEISPDIVMPVPDTSRTAAIALAEDLHLPYREGLIKNRYVHRSFIMDGQGKRESAVELKLIPIASEIVGKNILLVDDSIVRGTTSKKIISLLKKYGAREIILASTCPPIRYPCFYGVDFPSPKELIASNNTVEKVAQELGAQEVLYLSEEALVEAIDAQGLCLACLNGAYPTSISEGNNFTAKREKDKKGPNIVISPPGGSHDLTNSL